MLISLGKSYLRRDGQVVGPVTDSGDGYNKKKYAVGDVTYTQEGFNNQAKFEHPFDLVRELEETSTFGCQPIPDNLIVDVVLLDKRQSFGMLSQDVPWNKITHYKILRNHSEPWVPNTLPLYPPQDGHKILMNVLTRFGETKLGVLASDADWGCVVAYQLIVGKKEKVDGTNPWVPNSYEYTKNIPLMAKVVVMYSNGSMRTVKYSTETMKNAVAIKY